MLFRSYAAAVAGGWLAGTNAARLAKGLAPIRLPPTTMIGALMHFVCGGGEPEASGRGGFQPMPPNFGLLPELPVRIREKRARYGAYRDRALTDLRGVLNELEAQGADLKAIAAPTV